MGQGPDGARVAKMEWNGMAASLFLQDGSSGPAARRLATIRIADSGAWPDAGGSPLSVVQRFSACREQFTLTDVRAV